MIPLKSRHRLLFFLPLILSLFVSGHQHTRPAIRHLAKKAISLFLAVVDVVVRYFSPTLDHTPTHYIYIYTYYFRPPTLLARTGLLLPCRAQSSRRGGLGIREPALCLRLCSPSFGAWLGRVSTCSVRSVSVGFAVGGADRLWVKKKGAEVFPCIYMLLFLLF